MNSWDEVGSVDYSLPPDTILPSQVDRSKELCQEPALVEQLIRDALIELQTTFSSLKKAKNRDKILSWFYGDPAPITFEMACQVLEMDFDCFRSVIPKVCKMWVQSEGKFPNMRQFRPLRGASTQQIGSAFINHGVRKPRRKCDGYGARSRRTNIESITE